jgi:hypothetical protein
LQLRIVEPQQRHPQAAVHDLSFETVDFTILESLHRIPASRTRGLVTGVDKIWSGLHSFCPPLNIRPAQNG